MTLTVNIGDAKARLSHLIAQAEAGEDVIIARDGVPAARIVPLDVPVSDTIVALRRERARRPRITSAEIRASKEWGRV